MTSKIRKITSKDRSALTTLIDSCFNITAKDSESVIDWKYYQGGEVISRVVVNEDKQFLSFYCNKRLDIVTDKKRYKSGLCLDMATHKDHRGKGYISQLSKKVYKEIKKKDYDLSFGFSNKYGIQVDKYSKGYGYKIVGEFRQYYKPVIRTKKSIYGIKETEKFENIVPFKHVLQVDVSTEYLNWRFNQFPEERYKIFDVVHGKKKVGQVVLRNKAKKLEILKILDISDINIVEVLKAINDLAFQFKSRILVINLLEKSKWEKVLKSSHFLRLPNKKKYYLTVKIHSEQVDQDEILDPENWLIMGGDIL